MEESVHNGLHWSIRGDFSSLSAANGKLNQQTRETLSCVVAD